MKLVTRMLATMAVCALVVGTVDAQGQGRGQGGQGRGGQGGRGGFGGGGTGPIQLVQNAAVLEDIKATDEQKTKLKDWATEAQPKFQAKLQEKLQDVPMEERFQKMAAIQAELNKDLWKEIDGVLKPEQSSRVKQIFVQALGVRAFTNPEVTEKLKIADDQKEKIAAITMEYTTALREIPGAGGLGGGRGAGGAGGRGAGGAGGRGAGGAGGRGAGGAGGFGAITPENQKKLDDLNKATMTKIKDVLKDDQKKTWTDMTGKEFDVAKLRPAPRGQ